MVSKQAEQLSLKLMGISPLHGSHPAVPFASGATSSHGLRLYGSIIMLACLAAHQPQQVSPFLRLSLRTPPALPACCLSVFLFL